MVADGLARRLAVALLAFEALLAVLHAWVCSTPDVPPMLLEFGHLNSEGGLGTWFSSLQFAALAAALYALWTREAGLWLALAAGALFLSADEAASIHERLGSVVSYVVSRGTPDTALGWVRVNYHSYYWLLLYVPLALPAAGVVARFLWTRLERHRRAMLCGIGIFFLGAVLLDFLEGRFGPADHGPLLVGPVLVDVVLLEEVLEMFGVSLVLAACLEHAVRRFDPTREGNTALACRNSPVTPGAGTG